MISYGETNKQYRIDLKSFTDFCRSLKERLDTEREVILTELGRQDSAVTHKLAEVQKVSIEIIQIDRQISVLGNAKPKQEDTIRELKQKKANLENTITTLEQKLQEQTESYSNSLKNAEACDVTLRNLTTLTKTVLQELTTDLSVTLPDYKSPSNLKPSQESKEERAARLRRMAEEQTIALIQKEPRGLFSLVRIKCDDNVGTVALQYIETKSDYILQVGEAPVFAEGINVLKKAKQDNPTFRVQNDNDQASFCQNNEFYKTKDEVESKIDQYMTDIKAFIALDLPESARMKEASREYAYACLKLWIQKEKEKLAFKFEYPNIEIKEPEQIEATEEITRGNVKTELGYTGEPGLVQSRRQSYIISGTTNVATTKPIPSRKTLTQKIKPDPNLWSKWIETNLKTSLPYVEKSDTKKYELFLELKDGNTTTGILTIFQKGQYIEQEAKKETGSYKLVLQSGKQFLDTPLLNYLALQDPIMKSITIVATGQSGSGKGVNSSALLAFILQIYLSTYKKISENARISVAFQEIFMNPSNGLPKKQNLSIKTPEPSINPLEQNIIPPSSSEIEWHNLCDLKQCGNLLRDATALKNLEQWKLASDKNRITRPTLNNQAGSSRSIKITQLQFFLSQSEIYYVTLIDTAGYEDYQQSTKDTSSPLLDYYKRIVSLELAKQYELKTIQEGKFITASLHYLEQVIIRYRDLQSAITGFEQDKTFDNDEDFTKELNKFSQGTTGADKNWMTPYLPLQSSLIVLATIKSKMRDKVEVGAAQSTLKFLDRILL